MDYLDDYSLLTIFEYLDRPTLLSCALVNKRWYYLSRYVTSKGHAKVSHDIIGRLHVEEQTKGLTQQLDNIDFYDIYHKHLRQELLRIQSQNDYEDNTDDCDTNAAHQKHKTESQLIEDFLAKYFHYCSGLNIYVRRYMKIERNSLMSSFNVSQTLKLLELWFIDFSNIGCCCDAANLLDSDNMPRLVRLELVSCHNVTGCCFWTMISRSPNLRRINLCCNRFDDLDHLEDCREVLPSGGRLDTINISNPPIREIAEALLEQSPQIKTLKSISLSDLIYYAARIDLSSLVDLKVHYSRAIDADNSIDLDQLYCLQHMINLETLHFMDDSSCDMPILFDEPLPDILFNLLDHLIGLKYLTIDSYSFLDEVTDQISDHLHRLGRLKMLHLSTKSINQDIESSLSRIRPTLLELNKDFILRFSCKW